MVRLNGLSIAPDEARQIVKYLSKYHGLAPEESRTAFYEAERRVIEEKVPEHQALLYRLTGDVNPLHADPSFAKAFGFDKPILHGLCSYGFTGRALLHTLCGSDPARFQHIEARFASPVLPGEALTVSMWEIGDGEAAEGDRLAARRHGALDGVHVLGRALQ